MWFVTRSLVRVVIEAGALMLADNGVCCYYDEISDKMEVHDQVQIRGTTEQQTITIPRPASRPHSTPEQSICRRQPINGKYDKSKVALKQNIQMTSILIMSSVRPVLHPDGRVQPGVRLRYQSGRSLTSSGTLTSPSRRFTMKQITLLRYLNFARSSNRRSARRRRT